jgi:hypothetical protein
MQRNRLSLILIGSVIAIIIIIVFSRIIYKSILDNEKAMSEGLPLTHTLISGDSIFAKGYWPEIKVNGVHQSKVRFPFSFLSYQDKYDIVIHRVEASKNLTIRIAENVVTDVSPSISYTILEDNKYYRVDYKSGKIPPVSDLNLVLNGVSIRKIIENDSALAYCLKCRNMSVTYGKSEPVDIFIEGQREIIGTATIPMDLLFLKRNGFLYIVILTPLNSKDAIPCWLLYKLIMDKDLAALELTNFSNEVEVRKTVEKK